MPVVAAQQNEASDNTEARNLAEVVVIGSRRPDRVVEESAVPVDVLSVDEAAVGGFTNLQGMLSSVLPSFNAHLVTGTAHSTLVPPFTMRGLTPDQSLVLINGRRRHPSALVNMAGTSRGSVSIDLNTIPQGAIKRIEVLRDGASAQYGSDAIAGVVNMVLDDANEGFSIEVVAGQYDTTLDGVPNFRGVRADANGNPLVRPGTTNRLTMISDGPAKRRDGEQTTVTAKWGLPIGDRGFVNLTGEFAKHRLAFRGGTDDGQTYPLLPNGQFDQRELTVNRYRQAVGTPPTENLTFFLNAGYDLGSDTELYAFGGIQDRDTIAGGNYREAWDEGRTVLDVYPDGFTPVIVGNNRDYSMALGVRGDLMGWSWDGSFVKGSNELSFLNTNTINVSLGSGSPTTMYGGAQRHDQGTFNLDLQKLIDVGVLASPVSVAFGFELREEEFTLSAGDAAASAVGMLRDANGNLVLDGNGNTRLAGIPFAQGALVFGQKDALNESRDAIGFYTEVDANLTDSWNLILAARYEDYSDFGDTLKGKIATRYEFTDSFSVRASLSSGFRAPSLHQQYYSQTNTNFVQGVLYDIVQLPASSPIAAVLGASPLKPEESTSTSLGVTWRPFSAVSVTLDAYKIDIDGRIVNTDLLQAQSILENAGFFGVQAARFFINGVNSETKGVDLVTTYDTLLGSGNLNLTFAANWNETKVGDVIATVGLASYFTPQQLLPRVFLRQMENAAPKSKATLSATWSNGGFGSTLRARHYGSTVSAGTTQALDQVVDAAVLFDLELRYQFTDKVHGAIGGNNLLDKYPKSAWETQGENATELALINPYPGSSPYGFHGRFLFAKLGVKF